MGVEELVEVSRDSEESFLSNEAMRRIVARTGGFDFIVDPFFNIHLSRVIDLLARGGTYITCGVYARLPDAGGNDVPVVGDRLGPVLITALQRNLSILASGLAGPPDLEAAVRDLSAGTLGVTIDSVFSGGDVAPFLERTYASPERFGKVIFRYEEPARRGPPGVAG
jgi:NADPH:quinone reductase-like Zn-dependent oxidoreductase